jgi:hypothetical protein
MAMAAKWKEFQFQRSSICWSRLSDGWKEIRSASQDPHRESGGPTDTTYVIKSLRSLAFFRPPKAIFVPGMYFFGFSRYSNCRRVSSMILCRLRRKRKTYQAFFIPGDTGLPVSIRVRKPFHGAGFAPKQAVEVGADLVAAAALERVTLSTASLPQESVNRRMAGPVGHVPISAHLKEVGTLTSITWVFSSAITLAGEKFTSLAIWNHTCRLDGLTGMIMQHLLMEGEDTEAWGSGQR